MPYRNDEFRIIELDTVMFPPEANSTTPTLMAGEVCLDKRKRSLSLARHRMPDVSRLSIKPAISRRIGGYGLHEK